MKPPTKTMIIKSHVSIVSSHIFIQPMIQKLWKTRVSRCIKYHLSSYIFMLPLGFLAVPNSLEQSWWPPLWPQNVCDSSAPSGAEARLQSLNVAFMDLSNYIDIDIDCGGYPLVNCHITMENHHATNGKINDFNGPFSMAMLNYQRV